MWIKTEFRTKAQHVDSLETEAAVNSEMAPCYSTSARQYALYWYLDKKITNQHTCLKTNHIGDVLVKCLVFVKETKNTVATLQ